MCRLRDPLIADHAPSAVSFSLSHQDDSSPIIAVADKRGVYHRVVGVIIGTKTERRLPRDAILANGRPVPATGVEGTDRVNFTGRVRCLTASARVQLGWPDEHQDAERGQSGREYPQFPGHKRSMRSID